jgi:hypothetical protein
MTIFNGTYRRNLGITRAAQASILGLALFAGASCSNTVGGKDDQERIAGIYFLQSVNGAAIPAAVAAQQGCNRTVQRGTFSISVGGPDARPMYDWSIAVAADCQPVPSGVDQGGDDVGNWGFKESTQLTLGSMMGRGFYSASLEETGGNPPAVTFSNAGNSYRFVRIMRWDDPRGLVFVDVVDQSGQPVSGVVLVFTDANGIQGGGTTQASGEVFTESVVGECKISITPPSGYALPTSQPNPVSVTVVEGQAQHVNVTLTKL